MRFDNEFQKYYVQSEHKSSMDLHYYEKQVEASMTPYIVEERELRATQMDIFSRLMRDRIILY
jgi:ATP-dependent Clp protease protease subunit